MSHSSIGWGILLSIWVYWSWGKMHLWQELEWIITICIYICIKWLWELFSKRGWESVPKGTIISFPLWGQQDFAPFCRKLTFQTGDYIKSWALDALQLILISPQMLICKGQYLPLMVAWTVFVQENYFPVKLNKEFCLDYMLKRVGEMWLTILRTEQSEGTWDTSFFQSMSYCPGKNVWEYADHDLDF